MKNYDAFKNTSEDLGRQFRRVKPASLEEARSIITGEKTGIKSLFIVRNIIDENSFTGTVYFYRLGKPYRKAVARFDIKGFGHTEKEFLGDFEGQVVKLGKQVKLPELGSAVPEIKADCAGIVYTVDDIYTELTWQNHLMLLKLEQDYLQPPEDEDC